jgi:hypothetical protein
MLDVGPFAITLYSVRTSETNPRKRMYPMIETSIPIVKTEATQSIPFAARSLF